MLDSIRPNRCVGSAQSRAKQDGACFNLAQGWALSAHYRAEIMGQQEVDMGAGHERGSDKG